MGLALGLKTLAFKGLGIFFVTGAKNGLICPYKAQ
jgi:hypothetical protein